MHLINNNWISGSGDEFVSTNPVTNEAIWHGREATTTDVDQAMISARGAFESWRHVVVSEREALLDKFAQKLSANKEELATLISQETGKPLWEALVEVGAMIGKVAISIVAHAKRCAKFAVTTAGKKATTRFKPHGVVAVIGPYNFPGHLANGHIVPALLAGNTVIFKPSEFTPAVAQLTLKIWLEAGLPAGVLNLLQGGRKTGEALLKAPGLDGIFFTGSSATGRVINENFATRPEVILALEMGGNNPLIVWEVKNLEAAALIAIESAFITAGQRCTCARRLVVQDDASGAEFINHLVGRMQKIRVGSPADRPEPFMGAVIGNAAADKVLRAQKELRELGATVLVESKRQRPDAAILTPGLIDVTTVKKRPDQEIFGPLLQVIRVADFDAALIEANNTAFGLAAGLVSDNTSFYDRFCTVVRAGIVNYNTALTGASSSAPFGGVGLSGNHRPSAYFAADYCSFPVASMEATELVVPEKLLPGLL